MQDHRVAGADVFEDAQRLTPVNHVILADHFHEIDALDRVAVQKIGRVFAAKAQAEAGKGRKGG